jgi:cation-transporting ATPase E
VDAARGVHPDGEGDNARRTPRWRGLVNRLARLRRPRDSQEPTPEAGQIPTDAGQPRSLIFAYRRELVPLTDAQQQPCLPDGLIPLARITLTETVRPEMVATMGALRRAGVAITLLSHDDSAHVRALVHALGMHIRAVGTGEGPDGGIAAKLAAPPAPAAGTALIGLTADEQVRVLHAMRARGAYVAMVGESVGDLPAMRAAQLRVVLRGGAQIALNIADLVLLADSLSALPAILRSGQRTINAALNTLKLYLSQTAAQLLLLGAVVAVQLPHFFYNPTQAGVISAYTLTMPNIVLRFWAPIGRTDGGMMRRALARVIIPAMFANGILALVTHLTFWRRTGDAAHSQLATTYALLGAGWLLILFVLPPSRFWAAAARPVGDRRVVWLVVALACVFCATLLVPVFRRWLRVDWLPSATDYLAIVVALGAWTLGLRAVWGILARVTGGGSRV